MSDDSDDLGELRDDDPPEAGGAEAAGGAEEAGDTEFQRLLEKLHIEHNFDFRQYKEASLLRRVRRRMGQLHVTSFATYIHYLDRNPEEYKALLDVILINVTRFFRDPDAWSVVREKVLPRLIEEAASTQSVRFWSAGCSSGEEPYTLAMLVAEALRQASRELDVKIYATDIDEDALTTARAGLYRLDNVKDVPRELFERYFVPEGQLYRFQRDLRKWCIFGRHDLTQDSPLSHLDFLICRNVLIYFDSDLQDRILPRFHYAIRERGHLFLGKSESMLARSRRFLPVDFKWRIFHRVTPVDVTGRPVPEGPPAAFGAGGARYVRADTQASQRLHGIVDALPSAVMVIDPGDTVLTWNAAAETLYDTPADSAIGRKFRDLDISYRVEGLRSRIEEVKATHARARLQDVSFPRRSGETVHVTLVVSPLYDERRRLSGVVVAADDVTDQARLRDEVGRISEQSATANEELQSTNEELETTNEELQSTNEELETTNEELQSTNEELETTVEELQSINAELATINSELEKRTAELNELALFHSGVLDATGLAVFVLDASLQVKTWNWPAARMWGLRPEDAVNREFIALPIGEITSRARDALRRVLNNRASEIVPDVTYMLPDGRQHKTRLRLAPLAAADGTLLGLLGTAAPDSNLLETGSRGPD